jgi:hypothetical protein
VPANPVPVIPVATNVVVAEVAVVIFVGLLIGQYFILYPNEGAGVAAGKVTVNVAIMN